METFSKFYQPAYDFLIAIAEPVCRPELIHEYKITPYSLYAASSVGLKTTDLLNGLKRLSKNELDTKLIKFIKEKTEKCGKLRLVLKKGRYFVESPHEHILEKLLNNNEIFDCRIKSDDLQYDRRGFIVEKLVHEQIEISGMSNKRVNLNKAVGLDTNEDNDTEIIEEVLSFEISEEKLETVKRKCNDLGYPCVEEYDFRNDKKNENLSMSLKSIAKHRPYQEKSLSKMFGNGRARSGLIVLPCGAGKTLVGVTAVCTIKKSTMIFANTTVSVHQWCQQVYHWCKIPKWQVIEFSSQTKKKIPKNKPCILVTTYHMLGHKKKRSKDAETIMNEITTREWGLIVLDEVHVAPASTFRKCCSLVRSKTKLGLTATLLREDNKIGDLFYLIGPKLYEANWLDLQKNGYLALVQCVEVWCPMDSEFYIHYLSANNPKDSHAGSGKKITKRQSYLLSDFNPNKFRAMEYLINIHVNRGDKVLVFSDNIPLLKHSATLLRKPFIYGETRDQERKYWLHNFNHTNHTNCLFISSVGDTSIDLPDVNVVIQISSHYGSRRQEAQRLGRILRPKPRQGNEFNAFFYTLTSKDTLDMKYATKRQRFLVDQGYSFHVLTDLINDSTPNLHYGDAESRHELLQKVLTIIKSSKNLKETKYRDDINRNKSRKYDEFSDDNSDDEDIDMKRNVRRKTGNVNRITGNTGVYEEFTSRNTGVRGMLSSGAGNRKRGRQPRQKKPKKSQSLAMQKMLENHKKHKEKRLKYLPR